MHSHGRRGRRAPSKHAKTPNPHPKLKVSLLDKPAVQSSGALSVPAGAAPAAARAAAVEATNPEVKTGGDAARIVWMEHPVIK
jgi:hypothetical protein